ncbi:MAG: sugar phosphate isomerase/epimerase [Clostridia bacterium]|nr:sugar phosphate isomerase/epimerase [Clostridia bacterium]
MAIKAVSQFQIGTALNNRKQAEATFRLMKEAGYEGIELCYFMIRPTSVFYKIGMKASGTPIGRGGWMDWPAIMKDSGLKVVSVHQNVKALSKHLEKTAEEALSLGTHYVTLSNSHTNYSSSDDVSALADWLNETGEKLRTFGLGLIYHNHNVEFLHPVPDKTAYQMLIEKTDPSLVGFELDGFWAADAGADVLQVMDLLGPRLKLYHITDRGSTRKSAAATPIIPYMGAELGRGNMNLEPMILKALDLGVEAIILETHRGWEDGDPVGSMQTSAEYLARFL